MSQCKCTWVDCEAVAVHEHHSKDGRVWSNLCDEHHAQIEKDTDPGADVRRMLSSWVKANGGAAEMARKMCE